MFTKHFKKAAIIVLAVFSTLGPLAAGAVEGGPMSEADRQARIRELQAEIDHLVAQIARMQLRQEWIEDAAVIETAPECNIHRDLFMGISGKDVDCLQEYLIDKNYMRPPATGTFDEATKAAVVKWQSEHDNEPTGFFGVDARMTYGALVANGQQEQ